MAHFFNSFLLGSTGGDLLKAYFAAAETAQKKAEAVTTVVVDRLLGLFAMLLFVSLMALANWNIVMSQQRFITVMLVVLGMLFVSGLVVVLSFWAVPNKPRLKFEAFLARLPKGEVLVRCIEACHAFGEKPGFLPRVLGWSMLLSLACVLQIVALGFGLGQPMGEHFRVLLLIVPAIICISALPITPSGIGVRENLYVFAAERHRDRHRGQDGIVTLAAGLRGQPVVEPHRRRGVPRLPQPPLPRLKSKRLAKQLFLVSFFG